MGEADELYGGDADVFDENGEFNPIGNEGDDGDEETDEDLPY